MYFPFGYFLCLLLMNLSVDWFHLFYVVDVPFCDDTGATERENIL